MNMKSVFGTFIMFCGLGLFFIGYLCLMFETTIAHKDFSIFTLVFLGGVATLFGAIITVDPKILEKKGEDSNEG